MIRLWLGDCNERLTELTEVRAFITDPPYGLSFMGRDWDTFGRQQEYKQQVENPKWADDDRDFPPWYSRGGVNADVVDFKKKAAIDFQAWSKLWLEKCYAALVPGGVIKIFSATRTFHRLATAMEEVGFVLVPGESLEAWAYGSGFPKSLNISKALDKRSGLALTSVVLVKRELNLVFDASGKSRNQIDKECGFRACNYLSYYEERKQPDPWFNVLPSPEKWEIMKKVLGIVGEGGKKFDCWFHEAEREVLGHRKVVPGVAFSSDGPDSLEVTAPATPEAKRFEGYGTAYKPAWEPFLVGGK